MQTRLEKICWRRFSLLVSSVSSIARVNNALCTSSLACFSSLGGEATVELVSIPAANLGNIGSLLLIWQPLFNFKVNSALVKVNAADSQLQTLGCRWARWSRALCTSSMDQ